MRVRGYVIGCETFHDSFAHEFLALSAPMNCAKPREFSGFIVQLVELTMRSLRSIWQNTFLGYNLVFCDGLRSILIRLGTDIYYICGSLRFKRVFIHTLYYFTSFCEQSNRVASFQSRIEKMIYRLESSRDVRTKHNILIKTGFKFKEQQIFLPITVHVSNLKISHRY